MTKDEIFEAMRPLVADRLAVAADKVALSSRLAADLGADSLDVLDLLFALRDKFKVDIRPEELNFARGPGAAPNAFLPREAVVKLLEWLPALKDAPDLGKVTPALVFRSITVETLCLLVERKTAASQP